MSPDPTAGSYKEFLAKVENVKDKFAKQVLTDDDLVLLTCESIARTYTYGEKGYGRE